MPQSHGHILIHIIFSTKHRTPLISADIQPHLIEYVAGILRNIRCTGIEINAVEDHIHILCNVARTKTISDLIGEVKSSSSRWMKTQGENLSDFAWQNGFGAFSVSQSSVPEVRSYIRDQQEHHKRMTFQEEFRLFLERHGIEFDERYVWD